MSNLLVLDTEHGGFVPNSTLLTAYFAVFNSAGDNIADLELFIKPDDGAYIVSPPAMKINQICLWEHDIKAISYTKAAEELRRFLFTHTLDGTYKLTPVGHNIAGDIKIIVDRLFKGRQTVWDHYCSYRKFDTGGLGMMAIRCGKLPAMEASLKCLADYFNIKNEQEHDAKSDALTTMKVFYKLENLFQ